MGSGQEGALMPSSMLQEVCILLHCVLALLNVLHASRCDVQTIVVDCIYMSSTCFSTGAPSVS